MDFDQLLEFIDREDQRLRDRYGNYPDEEKRILARTVKLGEEFGELCEEVLAHASFQRDEKLAKKDQENLSKEFADIVITTLLLAKALGVDIKKALEKKMSEIDKRYDQ